MTVIYLTPSGDTSGAADTANFQAAYAQAVAGAYKVSAFSTYSGITTIELAAGTFYINASSAMMSSAGISHPTAGLRFQGAGSALTNIIYTPSASGPLCVNAFWLVLRFEGISFFGNSSSSDFLDSNEGTAGSIQDFLFTDCSWGGSWQYGCSLSGSNNNSEWRFNDCSVSTSTLTSFVYTPASGGSDQFLNFWFSKFKFWSANGSWLNMNVGGSIAITDCDVSGWAPSTDTYLFNLLGTAHSRGVTTFKVDKLRVEHGSTHALLIKSQWAGGAISVNQYDGSSQLQGSSITYCDFELTNIAGPNIEFSNSQLPGMHNYSTSTNNYNYMSSAVYRNCSLVENPDATSFIRWTNGGNTGGAPRIHFQDTINPLSASGTFKCIVDTDMFWNLGSGAITSRKLATLVGANSDGPINGTQFQFRFPLNSVITRIKMWKVASGNSGAYDYKIQSTDATPVVYAEIKGTSAGAAIDFDTELGHGSPAPSPIFVPLTSDTARTISLLDAQNRTGIFTGFYLLVEYIG